MILYAHSAESEPSNHSTYWMLAAGLHLALLVWNPVLLRNTWRTVMGIGDSAVMVVDVPGPQTAALLGPRVILPVIPKATGIVRLPTPAAPALTPKPYRPMRLPMLPIPSDPGIGAGPGVIPIVIEKGKPTLPLPTAPVLSPGRTRMQPINPFGGGGTFSGEGGTGRVLVRPAEPAPIAKIPETVRAPRINTAHGPSIEGPLSGRAVLHRVIPEYPAWAEEQGIMGTVRLYFTVNQAGDVRSTVRVERTSGRPELDRLAVDALRQWRFTPTASDDGQQWGVITFTFSLARD